MNKWQKVFVNTYGAPTHEIGKEEFRLLGLVKNEVTVYYPSGTKSYIVTEDKCDMPKGYIDVPTLASNLRFWTFRGFKITTV